MKKIFLGLLIILILLNLYISSCLIKWTAVISGYAVMSYAFTACVNAKKSFEYDEKCNEYNRLYDVFEKIREEVPQNKEFRFLMPKSFWELNKK